MSVFRIVPNLACDDPTALAAFYRDPVAMEAVKDIGFIATLADPESVLVAQASLAPEERSAAPVPERPIEGDDLGAVTETAPRSNDVLECRPVVELWGARRRFVRDPAGRISNAPKHRRPA